MGNDEIDKGDIEFGPARWECKTVRMTAPQTHLRQWSQRARRAVFPPAQVLLTSGLGLETGSQAQLGHDLLCDFGRVTSPSGCVPHFFRESADLDQGRRQLLGALSAVPGNGAQQREAEEAGLPPSDLLPSSPLLHKLDFLHGFI